MNFKKLSSALRAPVVVLLVAMMLFATVVPTNAATPVFSIKTVVKDASVTITTMNIPANQHYIVRMGLYGTLAINGIEVGQFDSGAGGSFEATFNIPDALKGQAMIAIRMDSTPGGYYSYNYFYNNPQTTPAPTPGYSGVPTFSIVSVDPNNKVKIRTNNFPKNLDFVAKMGEYGTYAKNGIAVGNLNSGVGGTFEAEFAIPDALKDKSPIAIRLDSTNGVYYAYNWFTNTVPNPNVVPGYTGIPTFSIKAVDVDNTVTILTKNFPAGLKFTARMGAYGTKGVGGEVVGTIDSAGGSFEATFPIPAGLKGSYQIAIRLDGPNNYYYAYNWFYNKTGSVAPVPVTPAEPIPTISISSVVKNTTVTVQTWNYPANQTFKVTMGEYGTYGVNGIAIQDWASGAGGSQSITFNIPAELANRQRIAIRLQTADGKYFSYNWFWNN